MKLDPRLDGLSNESCQVFWENLEAKFLVVLSSY